MKKRYTTPIMLSEKFITNEYVSACITGTIQCVYPGTKFNKGDNGVYDDFNGNESGWYYDSEHKPHGICGYNAIISFNGENASGFEAVNGRIDKTRPIYNISGYEEKTGLYYVTWTSKDTKANAEYHHKGRLDITNIDYSKPNHS